MEASGGTLEQRFSAVGSNCWGCILGRGQHSLAEQILLVSAPVLVWKSELGTVRHRRLCRVSPSSEDGQRVSAFGVGNVTMVSKMCRNSDQKCSARQPHERNQAGKVRVMPEGQGELGHFGLMLYFMVL